MRSGSLPRFFAAAMRDVAEDSLVTIDAASETPPVFTMSGVGACTWPSRRRFGRLVLESAVVFVAAATITTSLVIVLNDLSAPGANCRRLAAIWRFFHMTNG